jgi:hypothetical protein
MKEHAVAFADWIAMELYETIRVNFAEGGDAYLWDIIDHKEDITTSELYDYYIMKTEKPQKSGLSETPHAGENAIP